MFVMENISREAFFLDGKIVCVALMLISVIGCFANGLIVLTTVRSKNLHRPCNIFIALQASSDNFIQVANIPFWYYAFTEQLVTFYTCWKINFIFASAMDFTSLMMFFIALDRLMATTRPNFYRALNRAFYVGGVVACCLVYCAIFKYITYLSLTSELTLCLVAQAVTGITEHIWLGCQTVVMFGILGIYCKLLTILKNASINEYQKINRSLSTIIVVNLFGWFSALLCCSVVFFLSPNHRVFLAFEMPMGVLANMNLCAPFFIYYDRSTIYRREFQKFLGIKSHRIVSSTS